MVLQWLHHMTRRADTELLEGVESKTEINAADNVVIDPTLTMDLTTMNPPDVKGGDIGSELEENAVKQEQKVEEVQVEEVQGPPSTEKAVSGNNGYETEDATEPVILYNDDDDDNAGSQEEVDIAAEGRASTGDNDAAGTTKEAISPPSNMDTEPERPHVNSTAISVVGIDADNETESEVTNNNMDSELENVLAASTVESQVNETLQGSTNATNTTTITESSSTSSAETVDVPTKTIAPTDSASEASSSPPTKKPSTSMTSTSSPTPIPTDEVYEESTDDSPLPATNDPTAKNIDDDGTSEDNDAINEEELPPAAQDWDNTTMDEMYREEEEEVKKVGGFLTFASIILMVYTAYQMSENPDGICAR
jgi:hypothetical protein